MREKRGVTTNTLIAIDSGLAYVKAVRVRESWEGYRIHTNSLKKMDAIRDQALHYFKKAILRLTGPELLDLRNFLPTWAVRDGLPKGMSI